MKGKSNEQSTLSGVFVDSLPGAQFGVGFGSVGGPSARASQIGGDVPSSGDDNEDRSYRDPLSTLELFPALHYKDYYVSKDGRVFSEKPRRNRSKDCRLREMKYSYDKDGYRRVFLYSEEERREITVARLICEVFNGPVTGQVVRHLDGDKLNNSFDNLRWGTHKENSEDSKIHGTWVHGEKVNTAKLSEEQVLEIREDNRTYAEIASDYGVTSGNVGHIKTGRSWKHVPS